MINKIKSHFKALQQSPFVDGFLKIFSGSVLSQIIAIIKIIILANLYSTESFGELEFVIANSAVLGSFIGLRYEVALMLPKFNKIAINVYLLSLILSVVSFCVLTAILFIASTFFSGLTPALILMCMTGAYGLFLTKSAALWKNRSEHFGKTALIDITKTVSVGVIQFVLIGEYFGLAVGYSLGMLITGLYFTIAILKRERMLGEMSNRLLMYSFKRYLKFSLFNIPGAFVNTVVNAVPSYFIPHFFSKSELGLFSLLKRIVIGPLNLIAGSLNHVVYQQFTKRIANGISVLPIFKKIIKNMAIAGSVIVIFIIGILELNLIDLLFGKEWSSLTDLIYLFIPALLIGFMAKSVARFAIYERTDIGLYFQLTNLAFTTVVFGINWGVSFEQVILFYSILQASIYLLQLMISYNLSKKT